MTDKETLLTLAQRCEQAGGRDALAIIIAEAETRLRLTEGCRECNVDDERQWKFIIRFLREFKK